MSNTLKVFIWIAVQLLFIQYSYAQKRNNLITGKELMELIAKEEILLVDVRTPQEFKWGHIEGAINIDYYDTKNFVPSIEKLDKKKTLVVYCAAGVRSHNSTKMLAKLNFKEVLDLKGGFNQWLKDGHDYVR